MDDVMQSSNRLVRTIVVSLIGTAFGFVVAVLIGMLVFGDSFVDVVSSPLVYVLALASVGVAIAQDRRARS
jgi:hypothetical protein